jgi:hypothetical protein
VRKGDDFTTFIVPKVEKNPEALTFPIPKDLFRPVAEKLYLLLYSYKFPISTFTEIHPVNTVLIVADRQAVGLKC